MERKYYQIVGEPSAVFSIEADLSEEQVCRIMKCEAVEEVPYERFCYPTPLENLSELLDKLKNMPP